MNSEQFGYVVQAQLELCQDMLEGKAAEYATDLDRLHNFKVAAELGAVTPMQALGGMMAKHTVSIYDMINSGHPYSPELWTEKITDHINYLILLRAIVTEEIVESQTIVDPY